jgi:hypothetical protein
MGDAAVKSGRQRRKLNKHMLALWVRHEYASWVLDMCKQEGLDQAGLIAAALEEFAARRKYPAAPPRLFIKAWKE